ncbi:ubiquitinyl hydrolase 1 [Entamoeba marina]
MTFPDVLNLSGYVNNLNNATYSVVATINHMGNTFFGHYFSFVNFEDKWYCCNDQSIQECSEEDIHRKDVYIIIYKRIIAQ